MVDGILLIDKDAGPTSHDIVNSVRRLFSQRRVGHTGTLDPNATGLLVLVLGRATRLAPWLQRAGKSYEGTIRLGLSTDTGDAQGSVTARAACAVTNEKIKQASASLTGEYEQLPPAYSAVKVEGAPAYLAARQGVPVRLKARKIAVSRFETDLVEAGDYPLAAFKAACSSGTYIRSLAVDLGAKLGCPAHIESLRRLRVGKFAVETASTIEQLADKDAAERGGKIIDMRSAVDFPEVHPEAGEMEAVLNGREVLAKVGPKGASASYAGPATVVKIVDPNSGRLAALGRAEELNAGEYRVRVKPFLVFASE